MQTSQVIVLSGLGLVTALLICERTRQIIQRYFFGDKYSESNIPEGTPEKGKDEDDIFFSILREYKTVVTTKRTKRNIDNQINE